jgi:hypothetical protein
LFSFASEEYDERSSRVKVFAFPTLAVESCLGPEGGAALGPWLTALTALRRLDIESKARCFCGFCLRMLKGMTIIDGYCSVCVFLVDATIPISILFVLKMIAITQKTIWTPMTSTRVLLSLAPSFMQLVLNA